MWHLLLCNDHIHIHSLYYYYYYYYYIEMPFPSRLYYDDFTTKVITFSFEKSSQSALDTSGLKFIQRTNFRVPKVVGVHVDKRPHSI